MPLSLVSTSDQRRPLPWAGKAWQAVWRGWCDGRLAHALLVTGPLGIGKRRFVTALGDMLLCTRPDAAGLACGVCPDCRLLALGNHPDYVPIGPDAEGKSAEIRIAAVRQLIDREALKPHRGRRKVIVIDPAHQLNRNAANSLLKTLEEPAPTTLIILLTEAPSRLPATIRSRCQRVALAPPSESVALEWLADRVAGHSPRRLLCLAHGAPLRALAYLEEGRLARHEALFASFHDLITKARDPITEAEGWIANEPRLSCEWLAGWICDCLRLAVDNDCPCLIDVERRPELSRLARGLDVARAHRLLHRAWQACGEASSTINKQLLFESLLIELSRVRR